VIPEVRCRVGIVVHAHVYHAAGPVVLLHRVPHDGLGDGSTIVAEIQYPAALAFGIEQYRALGFREGGGIIGVVDAYSIARIVRGGVPVGFLQTTSLRLQPRGRPQGGAMIIVPDAAVAIVGVRTLSEEGDGEEGGRRGGGGREVHCKLLVMQEM